MQVGSLGWEDPLEEEMATHSSILAWEIPWTEEPGRLQSMGLQKTWQLNNNNNVYVSTLLSQFLLLPPQLCPQVCSLCLQLYSCPANRFIRITFPDSIYMH